MRRSFLSVLVLASLIVGVESCKKGDTGPAGPAGPTGAQGTPGANGAQGAQGADGTKILSGATAPAAGVGAVNDFYFNTATGDLYGPKTSAGWGTPTSLKGANGAPGATGPQGPQGPAGTNGTNGTNGFDFIAGAGAPTAATGKVGDVYFNTTSSMLYKAKTASGWSDSTAIGVTATPRVFFLDVNLTAGRTEITNSRIATYHDTALMVDKGVTIHSSYTLNRVDVEQRIAAYPDWYTFNGREIMFIDAALTATGQYLMVPAQASDLTNTVGRQFIYTKDPKNAAFVAAVRAAGVATYGPGTIPGGTAGSANWNTNPPNPLVTGTTVSTNALVSGSPVYNGNPTVGGFFTPGAAAAGYLAGGLRYGKGTPMYSPTSLTNLPGATSIYTFSVADSMRLTENATTTGTSTYNSLCYWMYAEAARSPNGAQTGWAIDDLVDFYPVWKKAPLVNTGEFADYDVKKTIDLNTLADDNLGAAWTAARATGSINFDFQYGAPTGITPTNSNIAGLVPSTFLVGTSGNYAWYPGNYWATTGTTNPAPFTGAQYATKLQNLYNTWISMNNLGAGYVGYSGPGSGGEVGQVYGSGPTNDYGANGANGNVYFLTPPPYVFSDFVVYNGGQSFSLTSPAGYGTYTVPQPTITTGYPYGGIWIQNGIIKVNYRVYNGGKTLRNITAGSSTLPFNSDYSYNWTGPRGFNADSYTTGPWPSNQNIACQGYYFSGRFIPVAGARKDDVIIKFKIQTVPSNNPTTTPIVKKAGGEVK